MFPEALVADVRALIADKRQLIQAELVETNEKKQCWQQYRLLIGICMAFLTEKFMHLELPATVAPPAADQEEIDGLEAARDAAAAPDAPAETKEERKRRLNPERATEGQDQEPDEDPS